MMQCLGGKSCCTMQWLYSVDAGKCSHGQHIVTCTAGCFPPALVQCGIVYCLSRAECERVADDLEAKLSEMIMPLYNGRRRVK